MSKQVGLDECILCNTYIRVYILTNLGKRVRLQRLVRSLVQLDNTLRTYVSSCSAVPALPTDPFTISGPQNLEIDKLYVVQKRRSKYVEALKL